MKAILFDMDGTLVDTWKLYVHSYLATFKTILNREVSLEELRSWKPASETRLFQFVLKENWQEGYELFLKFYTEFHEGLFEGVYPKVTQCLENLHNQKIKLGIVTGKSKRAFHVTSKYIPFNHWDVIVCDDDVTKPKPSSEGLLKALQNLQIFPEEVMYVGDSIVDAYASLSANIEFAGVLWCKSHSEKKEFIRHVTSLGASILLNTPEDLLKISHT